MSAPTPICMQCQYYYVIDGQRAVCTRYPPPATDLSPCAEQLWRRLPVVTPTEPACGEFKKA